MKKKSKRTYVKLQSRKSVNPQKSKRKNKGANVVAKEGR